jgi:hypothetical protein
MVVPKILSLVDIYYLQKTSHDPTGMPFQTCTSMCRCGHFHVSTPHTISSFVTQIARQNTWLTFHKHTKQSNNMTTAKTSNQQLHSTERWQDDCYEDYDYSVDENDYDDFSLSRRSSRFSSGPSYKNKRRQQPHQGKSGGSIYSSKHVRAKESLQKRRK